MKLLIKTKGGHEQGLGDVTGSISVANEAISLGHDVCIAVEGDKSAIELVRCSGYPFHIVSNASLLAVLASYQLPGSILLNQLNNPPELVAGLKELGWKVITLDDTGPASTLADIRINPEYFVNDSYSGPEYIPLNPVYREYHKKERIFPSRISSVLVTMGGSDTYGFTSTVMEALFNITWVLDITIIAGSAFQSDIFFKGTIGKSNHSVRVLHCLSPKEMADAMLQADLAISGAGLTLFELACTGTPVVVVCNEPFEEETADYLEKKGFGLNLGFHNPPCRGRITDIVMKIGEDGSARRQMSEQGRALIDGRGIERIVDLIFEGDVK